MLLSYEAEVITKYCQSEKYSADESQGELSHVKFGLWLLLNIGNMIRNTRHLKHIPVHKDDGSPATKLENEIELFISDSLKEYFPEIQFIGEEVGGELPEYGLGLSVDPIDGTWGFLSQNNTIATSLAFFKDKKAEIGMIMNPVTGEIGYAAKNGKSRIIQLDIFGEGDKGYELPNYLEDDSEILLLNYHPNNNGSEVINKLYRLWEQKKIKTVKSPGGSPAWAILESAKGNYIYLNLWDKAPAKSYDLAAAKLIIEGAGGNIYDINLNPISEIGHSGLFIAGADNKRLALFSQLFNE